MELNEKLWIDKEMLDQTIMVNWIARAMDEIFYASLLFIEQTGVIYNFIIAVEF